MSQSGGGGDNVTPVIIPAPTRIPRLFRIRDGDSEDLKAEGMVTTTGKVLVAALDLVSDYSPMFWQYDSLDSLNKESQLITHNVIEFYDEMPSIVLSRITDKPRAFFLYREHDLIGISGEGVIVEGLLTSNGNVSCCWLGPMASTFQHPCLKNLLALQCNPKTGITRFEYFKE